jgi:hypothetical protein
MFTFEATKAKPSSERDPRNSVSACVSASGFC